MFPAWSPNGQLVAFERESFRPYRISLWVIRRGGGRAHRVTADGQCPAWSPDGSRIAFLTYANPHLGVVRFDGQGRKLLSVAPGNCALAVEIALTRTLVKGYSDTHERGKQRYDLLMQILPQIMEMPDAAAALAKLRNAALADDTGASLNGVIKEMRALPQAAE